jgi:hypothetical protein
VPIGATRHVLASIVFQQNIEVSYLDVQKLGCYGVFNPKEDSPAVFAALCDPAAGEYALCTDEPFLAALERLTKEDLKELAKEQDIKVSSISSCKSLH